MFVDLLFTVKSAARGPVIGLSPRAHRPRIGASFPASSRSPIASQSRHGDAPLHQRSVPELSSFSDRATIFRLNNCKEAFPATIRNLQQHRTARARRILRTQQIKVRGDLDFAAAFRSALSRSTTTLLCGSSGFTAK